MLHPWERDHRVLNEARFKKDEIPYNLIHLLSGLPGAIRFASEDGALLYAQAEGRRGWLWIDEDAGEDERGKLMQALANRLQGAALPGISASPAAAESFAQLYARGSGVNYECEMVMEAYGCPKVKSPVGIDGTLVQAKRLHAETIAEYLAGFSEDAYGIAVEPMSQKQAAEGMIQSGNLYLWMVDGYPVSMANIAHRSPRHARINAVYTPPLQRKRGYASAAVAALCLRIEEEGLIPMLYADKSNPDSNKVYQNVGFVEQGAIVEIAFK